MATRSHSPPRCALPDARATCDPFILAEVPLPSQVGALPHSLGPFSSVSADVPPYLVVAPRSPVPVPPLTRAIPQRPTDSGRAHQPSGCVPVKNFYVQAWRFRPLDPELHPTGQMLRAGAISVNRTQGCWCPTIYLAFARGWMAVVS